MVKRLFLCYNYIILKIYLGGVFIMVDKVKDFTKKFYHKAKRRLTEISILRYIKTNLLFITYVLINLANSWMLRIVTMGDYFSIQAIISDLAFILIIGSIAYLLKPAKQIKVLFSLTIVMMLICLINAIYYENYVSFASFSLLSTASFLGDMDGSVVTTLIHLKDVILVCPPFILLIVHHVLKKRGYYVRVEKVERGKKRLLNTVVFGAVMVFLTITMMKPSDYSRLKKQWNREYLVQRFGIYVYQLNDAVKSTQSKFTSLFGYDSAAKTVREFYENRKTNDTFNDMTNEYTNIFEGKNVIVIHAESIMTHDMTLSFNNKELTPNLNRLASEGLFFDNYYPQVSVGTSSDTEFTFNTSLLPASTGTVFVNYWDRTYESMPNLLRQKGYYTASMHANNASFWNRNVMHKTLGYDKFYAKDSYDYSDDSKIMGMGLSDKEFFKQSTEKIKKINEEHDKFYLTLITLSNHTPWDDEDMYGDYTVDYKTIKADENGNQVEVALPYMEGTEIGRYFKSVHYADEAIGEFLSELDTAGLLDDAIVVVYGDHDAKISKKEYKYFYNYDFETGGQYDRNDERYVDVDYYNYELNRKVPFIIWSKNSKDSVVLNKTVNKVMGMYDVMPTLANMLNFDYKYALGHDIFNVQDNVVVFPNGNWVTDKMYYNAQKEEYLLLKDSVVNEDEIEKNKAYANQLLDVSDSIIVYDLEAEEKHEKK